jgi:site-specific DNA recombinase
MNPRHQQRRRDEIAATGSARRRLRCAIYTRKSTEEGLEQEFNSLDAQREACEAYVLSQKHDGWTALPDYYDDGGLSGGNMERPALKRLLEDVSAGRVDVIVVYKVDRLTRSLSDFARIVDTLDKHQVSFVSVTQHFNTTSSMGRLTLNVLLSFAQFEREIAGERIRDKITASKRKGMWMGGVVPFGYSVNDRKLEIVEEEAKTVRLIFETYASLGTVEALSDHLFEHDIKKTRDRKGAISHFSRATLYHMLNNLLYIGRVNHKGESFQGQHQPIISDAMWERVQSQLTENSNNQHGGRQSKHPSLLAGKIETQDGRMLIPTHTVKKGARYRYYADLKPAPKTQSTSKAKSGKTVLRIPATAIERIVADRLLVLLRSQTELAGLLEPKNLVAGVLREAIHTAQAFADQWHTKSAADQRSFLQAILVKVCLRSDHVEISLSRQSLLQIITSADPKTANHGLEDHPALEGDVVIIKTTDCLEAKGNGLRLVIRDDSASAPNLHLAPLIAQSFALRETLLNGPHGSIEAMSKALKLSNGYLTARIRLTFLAPKLIRRILQGEVPITLSQTRLLDAAKELPIKWSEQEQYFAALAR